MRRSCGFPGEGSLQCCAHFARELVALAGILLKAALSAALAAAILGIGLPKLAGAPWADVGAAMSRVSLTGVVSRALVTRPTICPVVCAATGTETPSVSRAVARRRRLGDIPAQSGNPGR